MLKVLRIVASMDPRFGGVVTAIKEFAALYHKCEEISVDVVCFDQPNSDWVANQDAFRIIPLGRRLTSYSINTRYYKWLYENARNYDIVILDGLWQFLVTGGYFLKVMKVPYCVFPHGMLDPYFSRSQATYLKKLPFWLLVERHVLAYAEAVIFTSEEEAKLAKISFPFFKAKECVVTLGVNAPKSNLGTDEQIFLQTFPELVGKKVILYLSRIHPKKGVDMLLRAFASLNCADDVVLAIVGSGDVGFVNELQCLAVKLQVDHKIRWLGMLQDDLKWGAYSVAETLILPSHQENFGIVVAESLSSGTPVLITDKVNIWREVDSASAGFVSPDTVDGIEYLLSQWLSLSETKKAQMNENALCCYNDNFSIDRAADSLRLLLESLVGE